MSNLKVTPQQRAENRVVRMEKAAYQLRKAARRFGQGDDTQYAESWLLECARDYAAAVRAAQKGDKP